VNRLKAHGELEVVALASQVVDSWKRQITEQNRMNQAKEECRKHEKGMNGENVLHQDKDGSEGGIGKRRISQTDDSIKKAKAEEAPSAAPSRMDDSRRPTPEAVLAVTEDATRNKCIQMFYSALEVGVTELVSLASHEEDFDRDDLLSVAGEKAVELEKSLYDACANTQPDTVYKTKFRSKYLNLIEKTNPKLRQSILRGMLSTVRFMSMTSQEMASEELRREMEAMAQENLLKVRSAKDLSAETEMFQCGRCKQRKCKYYQMQTRSADEPMTTYVTCVYCGNRWKC
jgi:transcription elongation factor S-II